MGLSLSLLGGYRGEKERDFGLIMVYKTEKMETVA